MLSNCKTLLFFLCTLFSKTLSAQELVRVLDETITVNSTTSLSGYTRNTASIALPDKTIGYIYRISVFPRGGVNVSNTLIDLLQEFGAANIKIGASLLQFAVQNNDGESVDAFIFSNATDMQNFYAKNDGYWSTCKSMPNRSSSCFSTKECMGKKIYFGFKNNNISQGLDVKLEIVAIVDGSAASETKYSYTITNATDRQLKYFISIDNVNWEAATLKNGYQHNYSNEKKEIYFKIYTDTNNFVFYRLEGDERYKIIWNANKGKWDVVKD